MPIRNKHARRYIRELMRELPCGRAEKRRIRSEFAQTMESYLDDTPEPSIADLYKAFGTPEELAHEMFSNLTPEQWKCKSNHRKWRTCIVCCALAVVITSVGLWGASAIYWEWNNPFRNIPSNVYIPRTREQFSHLPEWGQNWYKYELTYTFGPDDTVLSATDLDGNPVDVDENGAPRDKNYPLCEYYLNMVKYMPEK